MSRLRVAAFVAGGPVALCGLDALAASHEVAVIVRAPARWGWRARFARAARVLGWRRADPVSMWARRAGVLELTPGAADDGSVTARLRALAVDVGCIATYSRKIPDAVLRAAGGTCLNLHMSLLPRHRGANPLFWTYHAGDADAGVTVHVATARLDAGPILMRERFPIGRGESVVDVHARGASLGGRLLARAVTEWAKGAGVCVEQNEAGATQAPAPVRGKRYAALASWSAEQSWHFLAGLLARYREPLVDTRGTPVRYAGVPGYEVRDVMESPGSVTRHGAGWIAWARDGAVHLSAAHEPGTAA